MSKLGFLLIACLAAAPFICVATLFLTTILWLGGIIPGPHNLVVIQVLMMLQTNMQTCSERCGTSCQESLQRNCTAEYCAQNCSCG